MLLPGFLHAISELCILHLLQSGLLLLIFHLLHFLQVGLCILVILILVQILGD